MILSNSRKVRNLLDSAAHFWYDHRHGNSDCDIINLIRAALSRLGYGLRQLCDQH